MHSVMVVRHGRLVADGWWSPYAPELPHLLYSLSKSFTSTAVGLAVAEGLVDLDATVLSYFPELDAEITDPRSRSMRVRHVAAMASGHLTETLDRALANDPRRPGARLPARPARPRARHRLRLQPALHVHAGRDRPAALRPDPGRLPPAAAARPAGHRPGGLAAAPGRPGPRLHRAARHHRRDRPARAALPAARRVGGRAAARRGVGGARPPAGRSTTRPSRTRTGGRATASSSGWPGTATAATARSGSSASCCPSRTPWSP